MRGITQFTRSKVLVGVVILLAAATGGVVFAHFDNSPKMASSHTSVTSVTSVKPKTSESKPLNQVSNTTSGDTEADPCNKNVSKTTTSSGTNVSNTTTTDINCDSQSDDNSQNSVNITSDSSQTAVTGDSDGQSGNASNSDSTIINVHTR